MRGTELPIRRMRRCQHKHLSGRRCAMPVGKGVMDSTTKKVEWLCGLHTGTDCDECDAMLRAFPIRRDVTIDSVT